MKTVLRIADVMSRDLILLSPEMEINHAMSLLLQHHISGAPVVDAAGHLIGDLSKRDCLKAALDASYYRSWGKTVEAYMTRNVETLDADTDLVSATNLFLHSRFRRFPVLEYGVLVGQISRVDILKAMVANWD